MTPRTVDEAKHANRRQQYLLAAQRLIETKGYERMTIQDVLDATGTSKGALYHYFDSKQALLEGLVDHLVAAVKTLLVPCVDDPALPALDKLRRFFAVVGRFKLEHRRFMIELLRVWLSDDNALVRQKIYARARVQVEPLLRRMIEQGIAEGVFTTPYRDLASRIAMGIFNDLNDTLGHELLHPEPNIRRPAVERVLAGYTDALERVLGAPGGSLVLFEPEQLSDWFETLGQRHERKNDDTAKGDTAWNKALA